MLRLAGLWAHQSTLFNNGLDKLSIKFGNLSVVQNGKLCENYKEDEASEYMKSENIEIIIDFFSGSKNFTAYTMDLTKRYIEINADYRS